MKLFYACFFLVCTYVTQAQTIHSKIPIKDIAKQTYSKLHYSKLHLLGLELNDSLFIAAPSGKDEPTRAFWILPSGNVVKVDSPELKNKLIVSLSTWGDSTFFYYLGQRINLMFLSSVVQSRQTGVVNASSRKMFIPGSFVSTFHLGKVCHVLSLLEDKNEIYLSEIKGMEKVKETVIKSPFDLQTNSSPFTFISEKTLVSPFTAASPNKIYLYDNFLYVSMDRTAPDDTKPAKTSILKINLATGESENGTIVDSSGKNFTTYISDNHLFKITKNSRSKGADISIYNLRDFSISQTMTIKEQTPLAQNRSFKRDLIKTTDKESVWDAVSNNANGFIVANSIDSTNFVIRVGSYHLITRSDPAAFIPVVSSVPILAIAGAAARAIASSSSLIELESIDQYFYLVWDCQKEPSLANKPMSIMQAIDDYDITSFKQKKKFAYKAYLPGNSKIFGIYHESGSSFVSILLFGAP